MVIFPDLNNKLHFSDIKTYRAATEIRGVPPFWLGLQNTSYCFICHRVTGLEADHTIDAITSAGSEITFLQIKNTVNRALYVSVDLFIVRTMFLIIRRQCVFIIVIFSFSFTASADITDGTAIAAITIFTGRVNLSY